MTSGERPRRAQPYRERHASRDVTAKEVQGQRDLRVIELSSAEWAFPVVLVPKPDRTMRFCEDCRQLSEVVVRHVCLWPRMDDCIDFRGNAKVFSTLDRNSGYWQIPVADEDRDKKTLISHKGSPATFVTSSGNRMPRRPSKGPSICSSGDSSGRAATCT